MPNPNFRRWTADDIVKLRNLAQKHPAAAIAAQLGRSIGATAVQAHKLKLSLKMLRQTNEEPALSGVDPGPAGFDLHQ
jgi:hypothetical protein